MKCYSRVLTIAGSDSGGGAGIQADIKTFSALGCYGMSAITAVTSQNTTGVSGVFALPVEFLEKQIKTVLDDIGADAVKIGMLWSSDMIRAVSDLLTEYELDNIVVDPVMAAQSGDSLLGENAEKAYVDYLFPLATLFTPNLPEASRLSGRTIETVDDMKSVAKEFASHGCKSVLLKGGHLDSDECTDVLYIREEDEFMVYNSKRIHTGNNHGTGCTLSSALAAYLARGYTLKGAVDRAKDYITAALRAGAEYKIGNGHGPVHHFYDIW